ETGRVPAGALEQERQRLHSLPVAPFTAALGETRSVNTDQTIRFGSVRYSTPPGLVGEEVWARADGDELVIVADRSSATGPAGLVEVARHRLSTPGTRGSTWRTIPIIRRPRTAGHARPSSGRAARPSRRSSRSGRARTRGWSRPPRPARSGSGR